MASDLFSYRIEGYGGSAAKAPLGFASWLPGRLDVGPTSNSPRDAGSARFAQKGKPFLFPLLRWTRCRRKNSNPAPVCAPVVTNRALTPRLAGRFTSASPLVCVLDSHSAIGGFAVRSPLNAGGQGPLGRDLDGGKAAQQPSAWGQPSAFSSLGSELRCLTVILSVRLGRTLWMSFSASGDAPKPYRPYALWGVRQPWQPLGVAIRRVPRSGERSDLGAALNALLINRRADLKPKVSLWLILICSAWRYRLCWSVVRFALGERCQPEFFRALEHSKTAPAKCAWALFALPIVGDWQAPLLMRFACETTLVCLAFDGVAFLNDH